VALVPGYGPRQPNGPWNNWGLPKPPIRPVGSGFDPNSPYNYMGNTAAVSPPFKAIPPTKTAAVAPRPAVLSPMDRLLKSLYAGIETPAQQEARVNREVNAQMAAQQKMLDQEYARQRADALAQYQAQAAAGSAAAAMSGDLFKAVGGEYNAAAGEISGLSHALTGAAGATTAGEVAGANKALAASGNIPVESQGGAAPGGALQQGVEDYRAGTLGSQLFSGLGQAADFGLAGLASSSNLRATQTADAALQSSMHDIRDNQAKAIQALTAGRVDLAHTYMQDAKDAQIKSISLIQGIVAQRQATAQATAKLRASTATARAKATMDFAKYKLSVASLQARIQGQSFDQTMAKIKEGRMSKTAGFNQAATTARLTQAAAQAAVANGQVNIPLSKAKGILYDKTGKPMLDANGKTISSKGLLTPKTMTPGQMSGIMEKARSKVQEWFYGVVPAPGGKMVAANLAPNYDPDHPTYGKNVMSYVQAQKALTRMKVPRAAANDMLNQLWVRGNGGRPWLASEELSYARKAYGSARTDRYLMMMNKLKATGHYQKALELANAMASGGPMPGWLDVPSPYGPTG
jgi:hypothetical protein